MEYDHDHDVAVRVSKPLYEIFDVKDLCCTEHFVKFFEEYPDISRQYVLVWFCQKQYAIRDHISTLVGMIELAGEKLSVVETLLVLFYTYVPTTDVGPCVATTSTYDVCPPPRMWRLPILRRVASPLVDFDNPVGMPLSFSASELVDFCKVLSNSDMYIPDYAVVQFGERRTAEIFNACCALLDSEKLLSKKILYKINRTLPYSDGARKMIKVSGDLPYAKKFITDAMESAWRAQQEAFDSLREKF